MREQVRLPDLQSPQPVPGTHRMTTESLVFPLRPAHEEVIQCAQRSTKRRWLEPPVVPHPAKKDRPSPVSDVRQGEIVATMHLPPPHRLPHRLRCRVADGGGETDEQRSVTVHRPSRAKRIAQEVELLRRIAA